MIAVQKSQTAAVKALYQEFKCNKNAQDRVRMRSFFMHIIILLCICMYKKIGCS